MILLHSMALGKTLLSKTFVLCSTKEDINVSFTKLWLLKEASSRSSSLILLQRTCYVAPEFTLWSIPAFARYLFSVPHLLHFTGCLPLAPDGPSATRVLSVQFRPTGPPNAGMCLVWECGSWIGYWGLGVQAVALPPHWVNSSLQPRHCPHSAGPRAGDKVGIVCQRAKMHGMQCSGSPLGKEYETGRFCRLCPSFLLSPLYSHCISLYLFLFWPGPSRKPIYQVW